MAILCQAVDETVRRSPCFAHHVRNEAALTMHNLTSTEPEAVREWLRAICHEANMTSTQLARACGLPPPTINRFLNATKGAPKNLNANTISRIQRMAERLLSPSKSLKRGAIDRVAAPPRVASTGRRWTIRSVEVIGAVEAGARRAAAEWSAEEKYLWPAPIEAEYQSNFVVGLEIKDDSADVIYPVGTIVTCVAFTELGRGPRPGERVVMHRHVGDEIEVTVREYYIDQDANAWLLSRTSRPDLQESIALGQHKTPLPAGIKIPYRITGSFRPE